MEDREEQSSGGGENILGELEDQVTCWVCFETPFTDPVTLGCGHSFCRECCLKMYKKNPLCGFCRREFGLPLAPTNQDLVELAKKFKRQQSGEPEEAPMDSLNYDQESMWFYLPDEVVVDIFGNLEPADLGRTGLVCHHFHNLAEDSFLWRGLCKSHFPFVNVGSYDNDWKKCFVLRRNMQTGWESGRPGDFKVQVLRGHKDYISCFDYYRNNVVSGSADSTLQIWSTNKLKPIHELQGHLGVISAVQFNEIRIVSGATDGKVKIWDTASGQTTHTLTQGGAVNALQFSETRIVSAGADRTLKVFDTRTGQAQQTLQGHQNGVTSLDYTGNRVISCDNASIRVWDVRTGACLKSLVGGQVNCFQPVGVKDLVAGENDGTVRIWDMATGTCTHAFAGNWQQSVKGIECDGEKIVVGCADNSLKVFDYKAKRHLHDLRDHTAPINAVQFDGAKIVSASADNTLKVWDVKTGKRLYSLLGGSLQARSNNPPHPARPGASFLKFDEGRIVASFNSLLRVYSFTGESVEKKE